MKISMTMIVKNEEEHLRRLLPEIVPHVDEIVVVDTGSTDATVSVAREFGCVVGFFAWCEDFSAARAHSYNLATGDWIGWTDADDHWQSPENIRKVLEFAAVHPAAPTSVWCRYYYDQHLPSGAWIARHKRERFVKRDTGWRWEGRLHEHMIVDPPIPPMLETQDFAVYHNRDRTQDEARNARNIRILKQQLRDKPKDPRSFYDLGSQYYHGRRPARALVYYRRFLKSHEGKYRERPFECYQALHRMADCYRFLLRPDKAEPYDWQAFQLIPEWKDAPLGLAESAIMQGQWKRGLIWTQDGLNELRELPTDLLVLNDLDYNFHPRLAAHVAYAQLGAVQEALQTVDEALATVPDFPDLENAKKGYQTFLVDEQVARAALQIGETIDDEDRYILYQTLQPMVRRRPLVREKLAVPFLLRNKGADIIILCGPTLEPFGPHTPNVTGIGGSETAVIEVARGLAARGANVAVYNMCQEFEGQYGNVRYVDFQRFDLATPCKLFVAWRNPAAGQNKMPADKKWLWVHDCNWGPGLDARQLSVYDLIRPVSQWHADHLAWLYMQGEHTPLRKKLVATRNGITTAHFTRHDDDIARNPNLCLYSSAPDRGLEHLLAMWSAIRQGVPNAELHVFYGWETWQRSLGMYPPEVQQQQVAWRQMIEQGMTQPGITGHGRVTQPELHRWMKQANVLAYSTAFLEVSCITAMSCMASGCVVFSTRCGALPETCGNAGVLINGHPQSDAYRGAFVSGLTTFMQKPDVLDVYRERGYERAQLFDWQGVADEWLARLTTSGEEQTQAIVEVT